MTKSVSVLILLIVVLATQSEGQIAKDKCKFLGNVIASKVRNDFKTYWNQVTPENSGKWGSVEGVRDEMYWEFLDLAYDTAISNNLSFKHHNFVWGQQQPSWLADLPEAEQKEEVEEWIHAYCDRYPKTDFIDVVNEPLHAQPSYKNALGGSGSTGWDWVVWTFEKARHYCPEAKLILNDYNIVSSNIATDDFIEIIDILKVKNLIDGIGEQGHFLESTPAATITSNLNKLQKTGVPIYISEFDIDFADDQKQKSKYQELFPLFWNHAAVHGITLWGYVQNEIWRTNSYLVKSNGIERPAMVWLKEYVASSKGGTFCLPVAVEDTEAPVKVFPTILKNGVINIELQKPQSLTIYNEMGNTIIKSVFVEAGISELKIDVTSGLYFLRFTDHEKVTIRKVIVNAD
jgi:endo-1,4-beta-xylanase